MSSEIKKLLRQRLRQTLQSISAADRISASIQICDQVKNLPFWSTVRRVLAFVPTPHEPNIWPLLNPIVESGKVVVSFPRFQVSTGRYQVCEVQNRTKDLKPGRFGILEPESTCAVIPLNQL